MERLILPCLRFTLLFLLVAPIQTSAQVLMSTTGTTTTPSADAVLFLEGNGKQGLVIPIVNDVNNSTVSPAKGMVVFCTCSGQNNVQYYNGSSWTIAGGGATGLQTLTINQNQVTLSGTAPIQLASNFSANPNALFVYNSTSNSWEGMTLDALPTVAQGTRALVWNPSTTKWEFQTLSAATVADGSITGGNPGAGVKIAPNTITDANISISAGISINKLSGTMPVGNGGTGANTLSGVLVGNGTSAITGVTGGTPGQVLTISGGLPTWSPATNAAGVLTNDGAGVLTWKPAATAFTNTNIIPKGSAGGLVASSIFDDGTNVGIGTATPTHPLEVNGDAQIKPVIIGSSPYKGTSWFSMQHQSLPLNDKSYAFAQSKTGYTLINAPASGGTNFIDFRIDDISKMTILESGNVGIGTTTPAFLLDIKKDISIAASSDAHLRVFNPNTAASAKSGIRMENGGGWAVQLQTSNGDNWLELTNFLGTPYHRWTNDSYYPNAGGTAYVQGIGGNLALMGGNIGIGTTTPTNKLDIKGGDFGISDFYPFILLDASSSSDNSGINFIEAGTSKAYFYYNGFLDQIWLSNSSAGGAQHLSITTTGGVGLGQTAATNLLEVNGNASKAIAGGWLANSDKRIKTDIFDIDNSIELLKKLHPVKFKYTDEWKKKHPSIKDQYYYNFIAQEFQQVFPEAVQGSGEYLGNDKNEILQIDTYNAQIVTIKAVQELLKKVEMLELENKQLKGEVSLLKGNQQEDILVLKKQLEEVKKVLSLEAKKDN
jgi:Chaperone of endosialidase